MTSQYHKIFQLHVSRAIFPLWNFSSHCDYTCTLPNEGTRTAFLKGNWVNFYQIKVISFQIGQNIGFLGNVFFYFFYLLSLAKGCGMEVVALCPFVAFYKNLYVIHLEKYIYQICRKCL